jgi:arylsulfatase
MHQPPEFINTAPKSNALNIARTIFAILSVWLISCGAASAQTKKPNILIIWGDDIGQTNISAYTMGLVGYIFPVKPRIEWERLI